MHVDTDLRVDRVLHVEGKLEAHAIAHVAVQDKDEHLLTVDPRALGGVSREAVEVGTVISTQGDVAVHRDGTVQHRHVDASSIAELTAHRERDRQRIVAAWVRIGLLDLLGDESGFQDLEGREVARL
eukprot:748642-Hanusia_phi.AAC.1